MQTDCRVDVWLDEKTYKSFALYDRFIRTGGWKRPVIFLAAFSALAIISFIAAAAGKQGAWLLGGVLLVIGILFPASFFFQSLSGLSRRAVRLGLQSGSKRFAYSLAFKEDPHALIVYAVDKSPLSFSWTNIHGVWLGKDALYLYVQPDKVYILPQTQAADKWKAALDYLRQTVAAEKLHL